MAEKSRTYRDGIEVRTAVLGKAHVERATSRMTKFDEEFQDLITRYCWGEIWTRPGLERKTRSMLNLAMLAALGREEEFKLHLRATRNTGVSREEIKEVLLQVAIYAGVPAANSAFRMAREIFQELDSEAAR
jgi:4-carboxymuconolactone decarboxylase